MAALIVTKMLAGTCKQKLNFIQVAPDTCFFPAPPPPAGPKGIPTPMGCTTNTGKIKSGKANGVRHKNGEVANVKSTFPSIKGNEPGVGDLPPGNPKKGLVSGVNTGFADVKKGCPNCKAGGKDFVWFSSPGMGNG